MVQVREMAWWFLFLFGLIGNEIILFVWQYYTYHRDR
jgi:hypothetical protein